MSSLELERLQRENEKLKAKVRQQTSASDCLSGDLQTQIQIVARQKNEIQELRQEIKVLRKRIEEEKGQQQDTEHRYARVLEKLEEELEAYKKKYSKLENKIAPLVDQDTVRLKVLNEVEGNHQLELQNYKAKIETLKDEVLKLRRENEVLRHSLEQERLAREEEARRTKGQRNSEFAQDTINYLTFSMWKDMEAQLKNSYDQAKREAEFYKEKYFASEKKYHQRVMEYQQCLKESGA